MLQKSREKIDATAEKYFFPIVEWENEIITTKTCRIYALILQWKNYLRKAEA